MSNNTRHIVHAEAERRAPHPHANTLYTDRTHTPITEIIHTRHVLQQAVCSQSARKCRKRCTAAHAFMHARRGEPSEASSASAQPRPCRLRSPVSSAGRGQQGHPSGEGWHAPLETAGIYLLR